MSLKPPPHRLLIFLILFVFDGEMSPLNDK